MPAVRETSESTITRGILWAVVIVAVVAGVIWFFVAVSHSNDEVDCALRNSDHAMKGEPMEYCG